MKNPSTSVFRLAVRAHRFFSEYPQALPRVRKAARGRAALQSASREKDRHSFCGAAALECGASSRRFQPAWNFLPGSLALIAVAFVLTQRAEADAVHSMDDIQFWVGSGPNQAVLIIDWYDGKNAPADTLGRAIAWGYRWENGAEPNGLDMLQAIDAADSRLTLSFGSDPTFGTYFFGAGYDLDNDGSTFTFTTAPESGSTSDSNEADDHLVFGFNTNGYWSYLIDTTDGNTLPATWGYAESGATGRLLVDGAWDAWSFSSYIDNPDYNDLPPTLALAAVVPEPSSLALGGSALIFLGMIRRRR